MSTVEIRRPLATIDSPFGQVSPDMVQINIATNAHTSASFTAYTGSEAATSSSRVLSTDAAALMGRAQQIAFGLRTDTDTKINMFDGESAQDWDMFLTGPTYMMNISALKPAFAAVAKSALIGNLKLDIYTTFTGREQGNKSLLSAGRKIVQGEAKSPNLATRLRELTERLIAYWENNKRSTNATTNLLAEQRHSINLRGPLTQWYELLDASVESLKPTEEWLGLLSTSANIAFNNEVLTILRSQSHDFQEVIDTLCSEFQLLHVPGRNGKIGKLAPLAVMIESPAFPLLLHANSLLLNGDISQDLLPVQQVLIRGMPRSAHKASIDPALRKTDQGDYFLGGYPESRAAATGAVEIVPLPFFLGAALQRVTKISGNKPPDKDRVGQNMSVIDRLSVELASELAEKLVAQYARNIFYDKALGGTSSSVTVPLDVTLQPGNRYEVKTEQGTVFTGFLAGVTHSLSKSGGGGQASTSCQFTHIIFPGFELPS